MNPEELFTRTVAVLPGVVRERLDGDFPIDWPVLEEAETGAALGDAVRIRHRLPEPVETLVRRLILDVGIVPGDVAGGIERQGAANAWIHWVTMEGCGESYELRNDRSGDLHPDIHPEAIAGYATLAMALSTAVHEATQRWLEAGEHQRETAEDERGALAQCAVRMHARLQAPAENNSGRATTASLARALELAWNTQVIEVRAGLSGTRLSTARGARAPRRSHYAPRTGYRLHAFDAGEIRWLRALAERAAAGSGAGATEARPKAAAPRTQDERQTDDIQASHAETATIELGTAPDELMPDAEVTGLGRAVHQVPDAVVGRLTELHGTGVAKVLERFRNSRAVDALRRQIAPAVPGERPRAPGWLEKLAAVLLIDSGAQTRQGLRTGSMRLDSGPQPDGNYRGTESGTGAIGHLTAAGLMEQVRLSLAFANDAWVGLTALRDAGKEANWALLEAHSASSPLSAGDREILESARDIAQALDRVRPTPTGARGRRPPSALEQAATAAEALETVGPTVRTAAGWPGAAHAPNARDPEDSLKVAAMAEGLHAEVRRVANRLIAGRVAEARPYGESRNA